MRVFDSSDIRNVALIGHGHCGKTSLSSAILFNAGATERQFSVDEGSAVTDCDEEEIARKLSIASNIAGFAWGKTKINLIDTPGYNIFLNDARSSLVAADGCTVVLDGVAGPEVSTEKVWRYAEEFNLPVAFAVNKLDRERSSFKHCLDGVNKSFGRSAVPVGLPIGDEKQFCGVIDLIRMQAYLYKLGGNGKGEVQDIPPSHQQAATEAHQALVEMIAEGNDELLEEFFANWNASSRASGQRPPASRSRTPHFPGRPNVSRTKRRNRSAAKSLD